MQQTVMFVSTRYVPFHKDKHLHPYTFLSSPQKSCLIMYSFPEVSVNCLWFPTLPSPFLECPFYNFVKRQPYMAPGCGIWCFLLKSSPSQLSEARLFPDLFPLSSLFIETFPLFKILAWIPLLDLSPWWFWFFVLVSSDLSQLWKRYASMVSTAAKL